MFSSTSSSSNKKNRRIHDNNNSSHGGGSLPCCKEEQEEEITTAPDDDIMIHSIEQQEYERLLRIAEQSLRERDTKGDAVFLEMERMIMNDIEQEKEQEEKDQNTNTNSTKEALVLASDTGSSSTAAAMIKKEDEAMMAAREEEQEDTENENEGLKAQRLLLLEVDGDNRPTTKRKRRHQSEENAAKTTNYTFEERMHQLRRCKEQHDGTANFFSRSSIDSELYWWLRYQKLKYRKRKLSKEHVSALEKEGVDLNQQVYNSAQKKKMMIDQRVDQLREYKKQHGTANVSSSIDNRLYNWMNSQKVKHREGTLSKEYTSALEKEGVDLNLRLNKPAQKKMTFEERVDQLREYKKQYGTANVSRSIDKRLYEWLIKQKQYLRDGTLKKERALVLEKEGVDIKLEVDNPVQKKKKRHTFEERVDHLREYKKQHGTNNVSFSIDPRLHGWLNNQRSYLRAGTLRKERALVLEEEGVDLEEINLNLKVRNPNKKIHTFEERVDQLREYKRQHGTANVSKSMDKQLYKWLNKQKLYLRHGTLSKERELALEREEIDFRGYR